MICSRQACYKIGAFHPVGRDLQQHLFDTSALSVQNQISVTVYTCRICIGMVASCNLQHAAVCFEADHQCICCHLCSDESGFSCAEPMPLITCVEAPMLRLLLFANHPSIFPRSLLVKGADKRVYFCASDVYIIVYT